MEPLKNKERMAQQCTPDAQDDLENNQILTYTRVYTHAHTHTHTHTHTHKCYADQHTLACCIINTHNVCCTYSSVCLHLPASTCPCECGYGLAFVHIFSCHYAHPNLSPKQVQSDAVLKRNPFIIEMGSDVCTFCLVFVSNFSSADLQYPPVSMVIRKKLPTC